MRGGEKEGIIKDMSESIKYSTESLSKNSVKLPDKIQDKAFLGKDNDGVERRFIVNLASRIKDAKIISNDPKDNTPERRDEARKILNNFFSVNKFEELNNKKQDPSLEKYRQLNAENQVTRFGKAIYLVMNEMGLRNEVIAGSESVEKYFPKEEFGDGLADAVVHCVIDNPKIIGCLAQVDYWKSTIELPDADNYRDFLIKNIDGAIKNIAEEISKNQNVNDIRQSNLAITYLSSLKQEIYRQNEGDKDTDNIVNYLKDHIIFNGDSEVTEKNFEKDNKGNYIDKNFVDFIRNRERCGSELVGIVTGEEFYTVEEIDAVLDKYKSLDSYIRKDGSYGEVANLKKIKSVLGQCLYEAVEKSGNDNYRNTLNSLNTNMVDKFFVPETMKGLGDDILVNIAKNPYIKSQMELIFDLDKDNDFSSDFKINYSDIEKKLELIKKIENISSRFVGNKLMEYQGYSVEALKINGVLQDRIIKLKDAIKEQVEISRGLIIPESEVDQLKVVRELLDYIEKKESPPGSLDIMTQCTQIFEIVHKGGEKVFQSVKDEISFRMNMAFQYFHMRAAGGLLNNRGQSIESAIEECYKNDCIIGKDNLRFVKEGSNGLAIARFFDEIEEINFKNNYEILLQKILNDVDFLKSIKGKEDRSFFENDGVDWNDIDINDSNYVKRTYKQRFLDGGTEYQAKNTYFWADIKSNYSLDMNMARKAIVEKYWKQKIKAEGIYKDDYSLDKGLELSKHFLVATGEESVFNAAFAGHDDFAELILSEAKTVDSLSKMKPGASREAMKEVISFMRTWLRQQTYDDVDVLGPIKFKDINIFKLGEPKSDMYFYYCALLPKKVLIVQNFLMTEMITPKEVNVEVLKKLFDGVDKIVKYGQSVTTKEGTKTKKEIFHDKKNPRYNVPEVQKQLRKIIVKSILEKAATQWTYDWDYSSIDKLHQMVTHLYTTDEKNSKEERFIEENVWNEIYNQSKITAVVGRRLENKNRMK